jgi:hypothetical protein
MAGTAPLFSCAVVGLTITARHCVPVSESSPLGTQGLA